MAGLRGTAAHDYTGIGAAGKGRKVRSVLYDVGVVHFYQLLYFHHGLHICGTVLCSVVGYGEKKL